MAVLRREDILEYINNNRILIEPFIEKNLEPASYDLELGSILKAGTGMINLNDGDDFVLQSNEWASVSSKEIIQIPNDLCATYGIRSNITRRGLVHFGGPQIDPGYKGRLFVSVYNPTLEPINLRVGQEFFTIIFHKLTGEVSVPYSGSFQNQTNFPAEDVERMMRIRSENLSSIIDQVEDLDGSVNNLAENLKLLTGDVHEIKIFINNVKDKTKQWSKVVIGGMLFVLATIVAAALTYLVEQLLNG